MPNSPEQRSLAADVAEGLLRPDSATGHKELWDQLNDSDVATAALIYAERLRRVQSDPGDSFLHGIAAGLAIGTRVASAQQTMNEIESIEGEDTPAA